jgi:hypothetical protein
MRSRDTWLWRQHFGFHAEPHSAASGFDNAVGAHGFIRALATGSEHG